MCLILFAYRVRADAPLIVAANRDEFYARPTEAAHRWPHAPTIFAGRDLEAGGTWLGIGSSGRFAAVTNFTEDPPATARPGSRGELTAQFLEGSAEALGYARNLDLDRYRGFSLLLFDGDQLVCASNRAGIELLDPGVHGLANVQINCDWPKVLRGREGLEVITRQPGPVDARALIDLLADSSLPDDADLPDRGRSIDFERRAAPCFIASDEYGTRASTAVVLESDQVRFVEQNYGRLGQPGARIETTLDLAR